MHCASLANLLTIAAVKANRHILHVLLALLLVLSQQLGMAHAVSHWSDFRQGTQQVQGGDGADGGLSAGLALDHNCSQCAAFAQLATTARRKRTASCRSPKAYAARVPTIRALHPWADTR
jgi:hypothetical protein